MLAAVDDAADAHQVARLETLHVRADGGDPAHDLVARHTGVLGAIPFGTHLVQVGVADAAEGDVDLDIMHAGRAAGDLQRFERLVARVGAIGFHKHLQTP